ncbi:MAG: hypothetical protein IPM76_03115 [Chloroflexi bacterium]|nr:hypothetical protein [Chloroflexota bacterium]
MLFYRFSELIPQHFGIPIHFLRYHQEGDDYKLIKHLNMNQLNVPSGLGLQEHYCRRWLSVRLLREMADRQAAGSTDRFPRRKSTYHAFWIQMIGIWRLDLSGRSFCRRG